MSQSFEELIAELSNGLPIGGQDIEDILIDYASSFPPGFGPVRRVFLSCCR